MNDLVVRDDKGQSYVIDNTRVFTPANMILGVLFSLVIGYMVGHRHSGCCGVPSVDNHNVTHDYNGDEVAK